MCLTALALFHIRRTVERIGCCLIFYYYFPILFGSDFSCDDYLCWLEVEVCLLLIPAGRQIHWHNSLLKCGLSLTWEFCVGFGFVYENLMFWFENITSLLENNLFCLKYMVTRLSLHRILVWKCVFIFLFGKFGFIKYFWKKNLLGRGIVGSTRLCV